MFRVFLVAALATFLLSESATAQQYSRRGRFLQRVRQEIFGAKPNTPTPSDKAPQKTPTPSQSPTKYSAKSHPKTPSRPTSTISSRNASIQSQAPRRKTSVVGRKGFGFNLVESKDDQLVVSNVISNSNADEAGLRRGDRVVEIGGIEANSIEEFEEISKVMNNGDQMEFLIKRNGSEKDMMITFGEMPEPEDLKLNDSSTAKTDRRYDFAPPQTSNGDSVLEGPAPRRPNANSMGQRQANFARSNIDQTGGKNVELQQLRNVIQRQNYQIRQLQAEIANLKRFGR